MISLVKVLTNNIAILIMYLHACKIDKYYKKTFVEIQCKYISSNLVVKGFKNVQCNGILKIM